MLRRRWHQESAGVLLGITPAPPTGADGHSASLPRPIAKVVCNLLRSFGSSHRLRTAALYR